MRNFETWLSQFRDSIATYDYYVDFKKVAANAKKLKRELFLMNSLIGSKNIEEEFRSLVSEYPTVIPAIPILIAKREYEIFASDKEGGGWYRFKSMKHTVDEYCVFMRKTGLFSLIAKHLVSNLYDYVLGVEAGLDSNGRKNRGGHLMEDLVESYLKKAGVEYYKEMYASNVSTKWNINLSGLTNKGKTKKRFDFVVKGKECVYAIEANFYGGGGSKLNETARSYELLAKESKNIKGFKFVWFTDGIGWKSAKQNLQETFDELEDLYNIKELEDGIALRLFV